MTAKLIVRGLSAGYGPIKVLDGIDLEAPAGRLTVVVGPNGAGKTTTLKSIMGMTGKRAGSIAYEGRETIGLTSDRIARLGIAQHTPRRTPGRCAGAAHRQPDPARR